MLHEGLHRRGFLRLGALSFGGLALAQALPGSARAQAASSQSVIMICLPGGPSHIDMYDLKPEAPTEFRGEFLPIATNVPGFQICEHMPQQARIADKFSVVRGMRWLGRHDPYELLSGYPSQQTGQIRSAEKWPAFGSIVSRLRSPAESRLPGYVNLNDLRTVPETDDPEVPRYMGAQHAPFRPSGPGLDNLQLASGVTRGRFGERRELLERFELARRNAESLAKLDALDHYQQRAFDMVTSGAVYRALDLKQEDPRVCEKYAGCKDLLLARRLVEAGVSVVTLALGGFQKEAGNPVFGVWDTHADNFSGMKKLLPEYDRALATFLCDLYDRGLDQQVLVVVWGEFGRTPRIGAESNLGPQFATGRGHWWDAGFTLFAGGGLRMGQVVGETDARAEQVLGRAYTPQNVLATVYRVLGIDPAQTFPDFQGRPIHLLDDREPIRELL